METLIFKAKTRQEVAEEYGICVKTLCRWFLKANLIIPLGLIDPFHLRVIYETFGVPKSPEKSDFFRFFLAVMSHVLLNFDFRFVEIMSDNNI